MDTIGSQPAAIHRQEPPILLGTVRPPERLVLHRKRRAPARLRSCFRSSIASGGLPRRRGLARFLVVSVFVLLVRGLATSLCYGRFSLSPLCFAHSRTSDSRSGISPWSYDIRWNAAGCRINPTARGAFTCCRSAAI